MLVGELHENVFEARRQRPNLRHGNAVLQKLLVKIVKIEVVIDERVDGLAKNRGAANARESGARIAARASLPES